MNVCQALAIQVALVSEVFLIWVKIAIPAVTDWLPLGGDIGLQLLILLLPAIVLSEIMKIATEILRNLRGWRSDNT